MLVIIGGLIVAAIGMFISDMFTETVDKAYAKRKEGNN